VVAPAEAQALVALSLESSDVSAAREGWTEYLGSNGGDGGSRAQRPWEAHARAHLAALSGGARRR
jgi:hypothetical protein